MTAIAKNKKAVENHSFSLGASLIEDEAVGQPQKNSGAEQDFWGSSMSFDAVREGRIFGVFGVATHASTGVRLTGAMA